MKVARHMESKTCFLVGGYISSSYGFALKNHKEFLRSYMNEWKKDIARCYQRMLCYSISSDRVRVNTFSFITNKRLSSD